MQKQLDGVTSELADKNKQLAARSASVRADVAMESQLFYAKEEGVLKDRLIQGLRQQVRDLQAQIGSAEFDEPDYVLTPPPSKRRQLSKVQGCDVVGNSSNSPGSKAIRRLIGGKRPVSI